MVVDLDLTEAIEILSAPPGMPHAISAKRKVTSKSIVWVTATAAKSSHTTSTTTTESSIKRKTGLRKLSKAQVIPVKVLVLQTVLRIPIQLRPFKLRWQIKYFSKKILIYIYFVSVYISLLLYKFSNFNSQFTFEVWSCSITIRLRVSSVRLGNFTILLTLHILSYHCLLTLSLAIANFQS